MNIIIWNCKGALKPSFKKRVGDLVQNHNPAFWLLWKPRLGEIELGRSQTCRRLMEQSMPTPLAMQEGSRFCGMLTGFEIALLLKTE